MTFVFLIKSSVFPQHVYENSGAWWDGEVSSSSFIWKPRAPFSYYFITCTLTTAQSGRSRSWGGARSVHRFRGPSVCGALL